MNSNNSTTAVVSNQQTPPSPQTASRSPRTPRPEHTNITINITLVIIVAEFVMIITYNNIEKQ